MMKEGGQMRKIFVRLSLVLLVFSGFIFNTYSQTENSVLETMYSPYPATPFADM